MLLLGHTGITLGAAAILNAVLRKSRSLGENSSQKESWLVSLASYVDIRLLFIGSLLPDIIDKPVGLFFFRETFNHGRIFSHTLLFLAVLSLAGIYLYRRQSKNWLLVLASGTLAHLILDEMWHFPKTLLWPLFGFAFSREPGDWVLTVLRGFLTPEAYVPELVGGVIVLWLGVVLVRRRKLGTFMRRGSV